MSAQSHRPQSRGDTQRESSGTSSVSQLSSAKQPVPSIESPNRPGPSSRPSYATSIQSPVTASFRVPESPRQNDAGSRSNKTAKVAIPRLKRSADSQTDGVTRSGGRHRVTHACEPCRHRKTKCSGERPICRHCQDFKIDCYYADGKRDRVKKQFGSMTEKVADYEKFLRDLLTRVDEADGRVIRALLEKDESCQLPDGDIDGKSQVNADLDGVSDSGGESEASAGKGSTGALDRTDEDFTREGARVTGFMGKNSEITWLQRLRQENAYGSILTREDEADFEQRTGGAAPLDSSRVQEGAPPLPEMVEGFAVQDSSYHLDDLPIDTFAAIDPHEMPPLETAQELFTSYIIRCHPTFPVVGKKVLTAQFEKFISGRIRNPPAQWLAIINLIFAVGAKYAHLVQADWKGDDRDHLIYFSRARMLAMNGDKIFEHTDLQQVQVMGLMSFYFLCTGQVNRSWMIGGMALRGAMALGMNMRNESAALGDSLKEIRYRVWWALYTLEHRLCSMTGRTNCISDTMCTTPLPIPLEEDEFESSKSRALLQKEKQQNERNPLSSTVTPSLSSSTPSTDRSRSLSKPEVSRSPSSQQPAADLDWAKNVTPNASLYFLHLVQLTRVSQNIFYKLYNPSSVKGTWSEVQDIITELENLVETWYRNLPSVFDFKRKQREREFYDYRISLGFFYYGTKITIARPCLCRFDRKIESQSSKSHHFNRAHAMSCVESAQELLDLIPDVPNAVGLNSVGPWWSIIHWLVQATSVLMLEMSFRAHHMPEEAEGIFESTKKAIRWLHALGTDDFSARRAWLLCNSHLRSSAAKVGRDVTDLPTKAPEGRSSLSSHGRRDLTMDQLMSEFTQAGAPPMLYTTASNFPGLQPYAHYDPLMQFDECFDQMDGAMQYSETTPPDLDFMGHMYPHNASDRRDVDGHRYN